MTERDILFQAGDFWVKRAKRGFEVYRDGLTHATRCGIFGYDGEKGLQMAIDEVNHRAAQELK